MTGASPIEPPNQRLLAALAFSVGVHVLMLQAPRAPRLSPAQDMPGPVRVELAPARHASTHPTQAPGDEAPGAGTRPPEAGATAPGTGVPHGRRPHGQRPPARRTRPHRRHALIPPPPHDQRPNAPPSPTHPPVPPRAAPAPLRPAQSQGRHATLPDREGSRSRVLAELRLQLARHFRYPLLARRRGIQGRVLLEILVCPDGHICGRRLLQRSGHRILDRAALEAASRIRRVRLPHRLPERLALQVPVVYRLQGG
ncbi:MAG: energy transducer TonB [Gammaproteobacteria bacterium]|nr:MAG: energy transducer TonB [Gammaproteobacteria bacterium]